ncbi:MAG TPA: hypothetical protein VFA66_04910 [Gaiellaceae bacterium]|nr:hypothetical protein [Gaiellaceae bacterium]
MARKHGGEPLVMGGSITRSPDGRWHTLQTHSQYPTPMGVQEVWSSASRRRYPENWDGKPVGDVGYTIEWEQRRIACVCGHSLGDYAAYRVCRTSGQEQRLEEHGVVEDTAHLYGHTTERMRDGSRNERSKPRFWLTGEISFRARKSSAHFRCRGCARTHDRNLHRLGQQVFDSPAGHTFVLESARPG